MNKSIRLSGVIGEQMHREIVRAIHSFVHHKNA
jgi:hypothetical protein